MATSRPADSDAEAAISRLRPLAKFKERSHDTSRDTHLPFLASNPSAVRIVLLGDSMLERMKTTAASADLAPWPSATCLDQPEEGRLDGVFNAGVGGDKYANIIYRLVGNGDPDGNTGTAELGSLLEALRSQPVRLWVVHAGTNNLRAKQGLVDAEVASLRVMLEAVLAVSGADAKVLLTGLFYRRDIRPGLVDAANDKLRGLAAESGEKLGGGRVEFLGPASGIDLDRHLVDHVHLNEEGYRVWLRTLVPAMKKALQERSLPS